MEVKEEIINGCKIIYRSWVILNPKANILLVHGFGEHSGRYEEMSSRLNEAGYSVYSYDRRGEGASDGEHGHIANFDIQVEDFLAFKASYNQLSRVYLLAHSLGGLIVLKSIIDHSIDNVEGLVLSSPFIKTDDNMAPLLQKLAGIASRLLPKMRTVKVDPNLISRDPNEIKKYKEDPLIFQKAANARTGYEMIKTIKYVQSKFEKVYLPFLVVHGSADQIADSQGSKWLYERASSKDKTLKILDGLYHETMREPEKELFFQAVLQWMDDRVK